MAIKIRLARGGSKKRPFYRIVATDSRMPRDGRFIEKLGTYNPLLQKDDEKRVVMNMERVKYWIGLGAKPTDRIQRMLEADGTLPKTIRNNPQKAIAGKSAQERIKAKAEKQNNATEQTTDTTETKQTTDTTETKQTTDTTETEQTTDTTETKQTTDTTETEQTTDTTETEQTTDTTETEQT